MNLREAYKAPKIRRAKRALNIIKEKASRIAKAEKVKLSEELARFIHSRSVEHPPRKVELIIEKDEDGNAVVRLGGEVTAEQDTSQ